MSTRIKDRLNEFTQKVSTALGAHENQAMNTVLGGNRGMGPTGNRSNSDEARILMGFGVGSVRELLAVNTCHDRFRHIPVETKLAVMQLKADLDCARMTAQIFRHEPTDRQEQNLVPAVRHVLDNSFSKFCDLGGRLRAFGSTTAGSGDEWVPTAISSTYIEEYELERKVQAAFREMPMASNPYQIPVQTGVTQARIIGEGVAATSTNFGTEKIQFDAKKLVEYYILPEELDEDSAPNIMALARRDVLEAQRRAVENAILNGDDSVTHMDSNVSTSDDARRAWKGLRKLALAASSTVNFNSGVTESNLQAMIKLADKFGVNPNELMWILGPNAYSQLRILPSVTTQDKYGPNATVKSGAVAVYQGISVMISEFLASNLNAAGVYDGVTTDNTGILLVNSARFMTGRRRPIQVIAQKDPRAEYDRWQLVSYQRIDFKGHKQAGETYANGVLSTERSVIYGINVTV